jgi:uncharacterized protein YlxW (UPF0749 family)
MMALIDVSDLMTDPDFCDTVTIVKAQQVVNVDGLNQLSYSEPVTIEAVCQDTSADDYVKYVGHTFSNNSLTVFTSYKLQVSNEYTTIMYFRDRKWRLHKIAKDARNFGNGFQKCIFIWNKTS